VQKENGPFVPTTTSGEAAEILVITRYTNQGIRPNFPVTAKKCRQRIFARIHARGYDCQKKSAKTTDTKVIA
jgi:hypothetical protein